MAPQRLRKKGGETGSRIPAEKMRTLRNILIEILVLSLIFSTAGWQQVSAAGSQERLQAADGPVESPVNKKGTVEGGNTWTAERDSVSSLKLGHVFFNLNLDTVITPGTQSENFSYNGTSYKFRSENDISSNTWRWTYLRAQEYRQAGAAITVELLLPWSDDAAVQQYIYPGARTHTNAPYYALNASDSASANRLGALFHYLVQKMPWVNNWVVGNEINSQAEWNYTGSGDLSTNAIIAAQSFEQMEKAVEEEQPLAKAYICLDNVWNTARTDKQELTSRELLDRFAAIETGKSWNLAFHPYPVPYTREDDSVKWTLWGPSAAQYSYQTYDDDTGFLTAANLDVLTDHIRNQYGSTHRVILTEFGYDARAGETAQAAELLYTYKAAERNDMIDACIYQPWADNPADFRLNGVEASANGTKREIYSVFKNMTESSGIDESRYLNAIGISSWTDGIIYGKTKPKATVKYASFDRVFGDGRYSTAAAIAEAAFPDGAAKAVLVSGENFPDSLAASGYAGSLNLPILMTAKNSLPNETLSLIRKMGISQVVIIGGPGVISQEVESQLAQSEVRTERIYGDSRYETAEKLEAAVDFSTDACVLAYGENFADALSVSPWSYKLKMPILLTNKEIDPAVLAVAEKYSKVYIVGGTGVVSQSIEDTIRASGRTVQRIFGADRYGTSVEIAKEFADSAGTGYNNTLIANGENFPDALVGGMYGAMLGVPVLLVNSKDMNGLSFQFIRSTFPGAGATHLYVLGGTAAVSDAAASYLCTKDA
jgi:putative cell wall-binding protein